ncbi:hypothetical protein PR048_033458 [Dryococelus australis]|uniref:Uncharacterized protein n=1 Tax=Dryococelus australis TaxID=614101 RepID=A0ABQ9G0C7_9NEOP|nr:hypothetical protein PR048_033458 [Dryococelus australis]
MTGTADNVANRVQSPAGSPDFRVWESCRAIPLGHGFSQGSPVSPNLSFRCCSILTSITLIGSQDLDNTVGSFAYLDWLNCFLTRSDVAELSGPGELEFVNGFGTERDNIRPTLEWRDLGDSCGDLVAARPRSRSEGAIRATFTRTPSASSLLRARRARRKARAWGKREISEKTPPISDSHMRKSGSDPVENRSRFAHVGGEYSSRYTTTVHSFLSEKSRMPGILFTNHTLLFDSYLTDSNRRSCCEDSAPSASGTNDVALRSVVKKRRAGGGCSPKD